MISFVVMITCSSHVVAEINFKEAVITSSVAKVTL